ncbi:hypothetical protein PW5551_08940 [Petrotoga sp. 9PW.55.5.1]|uniref:hypothetical protein n=1 Tax=Petrotoga sp. 9PW.55.5.1 TaxID=1308979 RepID=UPI000DC4BE59|nr:hypothetical protein [Petrotoga sp. 9PW.55.5.1]RAO98597.1 hypothetical protein PW5551_08940 [Petrotoga sp. 9PW.55.5.1]
MEEIIKSAQKYIDENSEVDIEKLEKHLKSLYDEKEVDEYFSSLGEILSGLQDIYKNPMDLFFDNEKEEK